MFLAYVSRIGMSMSLVVSIVVSMVVSIVKISATCIALGGTIR